MKTRDLSELVVLAAIWGASFLFMRLAAGPFGPVALVAVRVAGAALFLLPWLVWRGQAPWLSRRAVPLFVAGLFTSALPFLGFSYAALSITAGLSSIFNATTPLFGALIAWLWLKDRLTWPRVLGLAIGFVGVVGLAWDKASFRPDASGVASGWAVLACLGAALCYGFAASYTKRHLSDVPPLAVAAGTQLGAALALLVPAWWWWPASAPSAGAWASALALALLCTGLAYLLYFRLMSRVGPTNTITVTFLIPGFAVLWGWSFLDESVTPAMLAGSAVILVGTALVTGVFPRAKPKMPPSGAEREWSS
ncbi:MULTISPECIES: DMT family transporter [Caldimonas]|uniref:DMT family transporter n=1 Tax=Caldimonas TaxID=196013 RepID=UPI00037AEC9D|nr:DMT family transporter [Caldimonas manganoxidans]MCX7660223.1 DMT family transporter [Caldimonas manganoxidans]